MEQNVAEWLRAQAVVPGVELHDDPDITWVVTRSSGRPAKFLGGRAKHSSPAGLPVKNFNRAGMASP